MGAAGRIARRCARFARIRADVDPVPGIVVLCNSATVIAEPLDAVEHVSFAQFATVATLMHLTRKVDGYSATAAIAPAFAHK